MKKDCCRTRHEILGLNIDKAEQGRERFYRTTDAARYETVAAIQTPHAVGGYQPLPHPDGRPEAQHPPRIASSVIEPKPVSEGGPARIREGGAS